MVLRFFGEKLLNYFHDCVYNSYEMYTVWGKVLKGKKRGKRLGFPTANITLHKNIPEGIYFSKTKVKNEVFPSLTFIGKAETFGERKHNCETYILQFDNNIYNNWITVYLIQKLRENKKFSSEKELIEEMNNDKKKAKEFFKLKS